MKGDPDTYSRTERINRERRADLDSGAAPDGREVPRRVAAGRRAPHRWPHGAIVSLRAAPVVVGVVVARLVRALDQKLFTRIRVIESDDRDGFRVGDANWAEGLWVLGRGAHVSRCLACHEEFRDNHGRREFCGLCRDDGEVAMHDGRPRDHAQTDVRPPYALDDECPF